MFLSFMVAGFLSTLNTQKKQKQEVAPQDAKEEDKVSVSEV